MHGDSKYSCVPAHILSQLSRSAPAAVIQIGVLLLVLPALWKSAWVEVIFQASGKIEIWIGWVD